MRDKHPTNAGQLLAKVHGRTVTAAVMQSVQVSDNKRLTAWVGGGTLGGWAGARCCMRKREGRK